MSTIAKESRLFSESFLVTREQREQQNGQKAFVIWLTGFSGAGKSTVARHLEANLFSKGVRTLVLDGDNTRSSINKDLNFSAEDRSENIRRVAEIARLLNDAGVVVITAFISPFISDRDMARSIIGDQCFVEVFIDTPLSVCIQRDPKGLYEKAQSGELKNFTGISSPYEAPVKPEVRVKTDHLSIDQTVQQIIDWLIQENYLNCTSPNE